MNQKRSIGMAKILILFFAAVLLVMLGAAPLTVRWYVGLRGMRGELFTVILICWYACSAPAALALWRMWTLLRRIGGGEPFAAANVRDIRCVSWCALVCALICVLGALYYPPFLVVTVVMVFLFAVVQVVAACFRAAMELAEENSLTI